jgi:LmbE family N-acetylglucosaminyl deacetylase
MMRNKPYKLAVWVFCAFFLLNGLSTAAPTDGIPSIEPFGKTDRVLIISPHPDDDIIGCAGAIQRSLAAGAKVRVVYITCGDNNVFSVILYNNLVSFLFRNKMLLLIEFVVFWSDKLLKLGCTRIVEAANAEKTLGLGAKDLIFLGYPDHGTDKMFVFYWDHSKPYRGIFSGRTRVPYEDGAGYNKEFTGDNVIDDLKNVIVDFKPTKIFVAHPSDVNGDHWASYLYAIASLSDLAGLVPQPQIYAYLVHVPDWPVPLGYHPELDITPPQEFFGESVNLVRWRQLKLTPEEIDAKRRAMTMHRSQMCVSSFYLMAFVRRNEIFGDFPAVTLEKRKSPVAAGTDIFTSDMPWLGYAVLDGSFLVRMKKPARLEKGLEINLFMAGLKDEVPFAGMPNIIMYTKDDKFKIFNASTDKYVECDAVSFDFMRDSAVFKVPLGLLGDPQRVIVGIETEPDCMPDGCTAFRNIFIKEAARHGEKKTLKRRGPRSWRCSRNIMIRTASRSAPR